MRKNKNFIKCDIKLIKNLLPNQGVKNAVKRDDGDDEIKGVETKVLNLIEDCRLELSVVAM